VVSRDTALHARAILERDAVRIGLGENGGDPEQDGCVLEVNDIEAAYAEIHGRLAEPSHQAQYSRRPRYRAFFVVAPDGLCYMVTQPVD
jgi:hypothetical protein